MTRAKRSASNWAIQRGNQHFLKPRHSYARVCTVGNADDIGETWECPTTSSDVACACCTNIAGVCGVFVEADVVTLPMNHDCKRHEWWWDRVMPIERTGTHPLSPPSSLTACVARQLNAIDKRNEYATYVRPMVIAFEDPKCIILRQVKFLFSPLFIIH